MEQLCTIIDEIEIDQIGARQLINKEIARFNKLRTRVLGNKEKEKVRDVDIRNYAKYLLEEGTTEEKRELLGQLRGKLILQEKKIEIVKE